MVNQLVEKPASLIDAIKAYEAADTITTYTNMMVEEAKWEALKHPIVYDEGLDLK